MSNKVSNSQKRLVELMNYYGLNQTELCKRTGLQKSALSNYLNGDRVPRQTQLSIISDPFNINPAWLMGYDVPMFLDRFSSPDEFELAWHRRGGGRHPIELSNLEHEVVLSYRCADQGIKDSVNKLLDIEVKKDAEEAI